MKRLADFSRPIHTVSADCRQIVMARDATMADALRKILEAW